MQKKYKVWFVFSVVNLLIVAVLGVLMRYKIGFEFPYFNQKHIQFAHSNFAFTGWLSHTLYAFILLLSASSAKSKFNKYYDLLVWTNLFCAYGMIGSFMVQGYGLLSIFFVSVTILVACLFMIFYFKESHPLQNTGSADKWFKTALIYNVMSSLGTLYLIYIMKSEHINLEKYLAALYFHLHFQYNGWFFFACIGLCLHLLQKMEILFNDQLFYKLLVVSCVPAYFLSTLWLKLPTWLYVITIMATIMQLTAWLIFALFVLKNLKLFSRKFSTPVAIMFALSASSVTVKFLLQFGSIIPEVSKLAFGFRPIVIAYLHLVLLGVITTFLLGYAFASEHLPASKLSKLGLSLFVGGIFITEIILLIQGVASFSYITVPYINQSLFAVAVVMFTGLLLILLAKLKDNYGLKNDVL